MVFQWLDRKSIRILCVRKMLTKVLKNRSKSFGELLAFLSLQSSLFFLFFFLFFFIFFLSFYFFNCFFLFFYILRLSFCLSLYLIFFTVLSFFLSFFSVPAFFLLFSFFIFSSCSFLTNWPSLRQFNCLEEKISIRKHVNISIAYFIWHLNIYTMPE